MEKLKHNIEKENILKEQITKENNNKISRLDFIKLVAFKSAFLKPCSTESWSSVKITSGFHENLSTFFKIFKEITLKNLTIKSSCYHQGKMFTH